MVLLSTYAPHAHLPEEQHVEFLAALEKQV